MMLHDMRNNDSIGNILLREGLQGLRQRLPLGWKIEEQRSKPSAATFDASVRLIAPDKRSSSLSISLKPRLDPRGAIALVSDQPEAQRPLLVLSNYLTPSTREQLAQGGLSYLDLTGNVRVSVREPGLFVQTEGAQKDPLREERPARSLKGSKAGRVVRALCELKLKGVRELAAEVGSSPGYVSRLLVLLDRQALIQRGDRGRITEVSWDKLIRRWAEDSPLQDRTTSQTYLDPRGLSTLLARLPKAKFQYAITGSLAASRLAPVAPPRLASLYVEDPITVAAELELLPAESGANVVLLVPNDEVVFQRQIRRDEMIFSSAGQVAADLLAGPGRSPAEADALLKWMAENQGAWRG